MEPFLKWAGGKRWLLPRLVPRIGEFNTYYEPFLGSAGLFFALEPKLAVLSDTNSELINCYRAVKSRCGAIISILSKLKVNADTYYSIRDRRYSRAQRIRRAAYFIYLNKTCWNGLYRVNRDGRFNVPVGRIGASVILFDSFHLRNVSRVLRKAKLKVCDFEDAVREAKSGDLVYFDPPYITTHLTNGFIKYNAKLFREADELRLARVSRELAKKGVHVIVSNAAHPLIRQQYDGSFYKTEVRRTSLIAADRNRRIEYPELVISTFPLNGR